MTELDAQEKPRPVPLTLASRQAFAREAQLGPDASAILEKHAHLEDGLASLLDAGLAEPAFRLIARMLDPVQSILWVVLAQELVAGEARGSGLDSARRALIDFARKPSPATALVAERVCGLLGATHPFAMAASALSLANDTRIHGDGSLETYPPGLFPDLVGRAVLLINLSLPGDERTKNLLAKELASRGVTLALSNKT